MTKHEEGFETFWEASSLNAVTIRSFADKLQKFLASVDANQIDRLNFADKGVVLHTPSKSTTLQGSLSNRKSTRAFTKTNLTTQELGAILAPLAERSDGTRSYASAGGLYSTQVFVLLTKPVSESLERGIYYFDPRTSTLHAAAKLPAWSKLPDWFNIEVTGMPQCVIGLLINDRQVRAKYGERAGRFMLIEVGEVLQILGQAVAGTKGLGGVAAGGVEDGALLETLGVHAQKMLVGGVYLVGK